MMYQLKQNKRKFSFLGEDFKKYLTVCFVLLFIVFSFSKNFQFFLSFLFSPVSLAGNYFYEKLSIFPKFFYEKNNLIIENEKLISDLENIKNKFLDYQSIKEENTYLYELLDIKPDGNLITSKIIRRFPQAPLDTIVIDRGLDDDLKEGFLILSSEKVSLGIISKVSNNWSFVSLNSSPQSSLDAYIGRNNESINIEGIGGGIIKSEVPLDFDVKVGDNIYSVQDYGYLLAIVKEIEKDNISGFKKVFMSLPSNISKTRFVFVKPF